MQIKNTYFPNLDGLRTLAFLAVYLTHCFSANTLAITQLGVYHSTTYFVENGSLGVNFFFVLSGLLITYLFFEEEASVNKVNILHFYFRRILRTWPLYYLCLLIGFVLFPLAAGIGNIVSTQTDVNPIWYVSFLGNFDVIRHEFPKYPPLGVLWSVGIEEQFYLVWPVLLLVCKKIRLLAFIYIAALSLLFRIFYHADDKVLYLHTLSVISDMTMGGLTAYLCFYSQHFIELAKKIKTWHIVTVYCIMAVVVYHRQELNIYAGYRATDRLIFSLFFSFVIVEQNYAAEHMFKLRNNRFLSKWGKLTYGLYCYHILSIVLVDHIFTLIQLNDYTLSFLIVKPLISLIIAATMSWISYYYFENWFLRMKHKYKPNTN